MKLRLLTIGLLITGIILAIVLVTMNSHGPEKDLEATRQQLRREGLKIDLDQFNFSTSPEMRNRAVPLSNPGMLLRRTLMEPLDLMAPIGSNTALLIWPLEKLPSTSTDDGWPTLRESLDENRSELDAASDAALSGPIEFNLNASAGSSMLLRHLAGMRSFSQSFGFRAVLALHDQNKNAAWTNLLASTRLVTAWRPEPVETSHMIRFVCVDQVFKTTWQLLQSQGWDDDKLAELQQEWESADFLAGLPETAAFTRASMVAVCQADRKVSAGTSLSLNQMIRAPRYGWVNLRAAWQQWRYQHNGTFEDEKALLLYYRDREINLGKAIKCQSWQQMCAVPGITNAAPFKSKYASRLQMMINSRQISLAVQGRGYRVGLLERAVEAETRRRVIITAIALERFRGQHGFYPKTLAELSPALLKNPPVDFMDGQPLRYRVNADGHFLLYSVGLDCVDNGGSLVQPISAEERYPNLPRWPIGVRRYNGSVMGSPGAMEGTDVAWPLPASTTEVKAAQEEEERQENLRKEAEASEAAAQEKAAEERRVALVQKLLDQWKLQTNSPPRKKEPVYQGKPLSEILRNEKVLGTNHPGIDALLTLRQITTNDEPSKAVFELPIRYDALTNLGEIGVILDGRTAESGADDQGEQQSVERASNGNCLLTWDTTYAAPGQHILQALCVLMPDENREPIKITGPLLPYFSTNLCEFLPRYNHYEDTGATFYAKLVESNGIYSIEIKSMSGAHLRTINGRTTNGIINEHWNLTDDHGKKYTNDIFDVSYDITLPNSGRRQKIK